MKTKFILWISALFLLLLMGAGCEKNPEDRENSQNKKDITVKKKEEKAPKGKDTVVPKAKEENPKMEVPDTVFAIPKENSIIEDFSYSECKESLDIGGASVRTAPRIQECVEYKGNNDGYLYIRHINATFNRCPDTIKATVSIEGNRLLVIEKETSPKCNCVCKYDLIYKIGPFVADRIYTLRLYQGRRIIRTIAPVRRVAED